MFLMQNTVKFPVAGTAGKFDFIIKQNVIFKTWTLFFYLSPLKLLNFSEM